MPVLCRATKAIEKMGDDEKETMVTGSEPIGALAREATRSFFS
jgi:hypothetical protein